MSVVGPSVILSGTTPQPIPAPSSSGGFIGVQVFNNSAYSIQVQIGSQSFIVGPQTSTFAPIGGGTTLVEASLLSSGQVATIYATWFNQGDPTPAAMSSYALNTGVVNITGGTVDATITSGTVNANITNASIPVSGTVNASITNATVPVSGSVSADITNATLQVAGTVDATLTGPVDVRTVDSISAGNLTVINNSATNIPAGSEHNYSMVMTTAGTSYTAAPAVSSRTFFMIQNPSGNNLSFGFGTLGNIFELYPAQGYEEIVGTNPLITLAITVMGTVADQKVSIVTWE